MNRTGSAEIDHTEAELCCLHYCNSLLNNSTMYSQKMIDLSFYSSFKVISSVVS